MGQLMKTCSKCGETKPLADFYKRAASRDGHQPSCKTCQKQETMDRYNSGENRERNIAKCREYYRNNKERLLKRAAVYRAENAELFQTPKYKFYNYKKSAKNRKFKFELSFEQFVALIESPCTYCGSDGGGVDREDNSIGYTVENSIPCCTACNMMKHKMSRQDFLDQCQRIVEHSNV